MNDPFDEAVKQLNSFSEEEYEALAKEIADIISGHDTMTDDYKATQCRHNGEGIWILSRGSRKKAHSIVTKTIAHYNPVWEQMTLNDEFNDYILAFLIGDGLEVEWRSE